MSAEPARTLPARGWPPRTAPERNRPARPPASRPAHRPPLRAVPDQRSHAPARRAPFVVLVCSLLVAGLVGVLVLNSLLTQNSYRIHNLQRQAAQLADTEQALRQQLAVDESPGMLRQRAVELGMVPAPNPVFVGDDGTLLGVPSPAPAPATPTTPLPPPGTGG